MTAQPTATRVRPRSVSLAAILQFAIALAFLSIPLIGLVYGTDAQALVDAAYSAYPEWLPAVLGLRFAVVTLGCVLAVVLLALRPARVYYRKA